MPAPEPLLRLLLIVFVLGMVTPQHYPTCCGGQYVPPCNRTVFVGTTLAAALVLWFAQRAADGGGRLLLLGAGLSAASCFLLAEPVVGNAIAVYRLGWDGPVALTGAATGVVFVAGAAGMYIVFAVEALLDR